MKQIFMEKLDFLVVVVCPGGGDEQDVSLSGMF